MILYNIAQSEKIKILSSIRDQRTKNRETKEQLRNCEIRYTSRDLIAMHPELGIKCPFISISTGIGNFLFSFLYILSMISD